MARLGITLGDPAGIGSEVVVKALSRFAVHQDSFVVFGSLSLIQSDANLAPLFQRLSMTPFQVGCLEKPGIYVYDVPAVGVDLRCAQPHEGNGRASLLALEKAVSMCLDQSIDGVVTAPIAKASWSLAGSSFTGHTSFLSSQIGNKEVSMAFYSPTLKVILATIHVPLVEVASYMSPDTLDRVARHGFDYMASLGIKCPRIALSGLNPHASEGGLFGSEEQEILIPFVDSFSYHSQKLLGPFSPDTVFYRALQGEFDLVISLYHDQGLIPLKLLAFDHAVNVTIGLPFVRTSPDHGTAFDIAYQNKANDQSMFEAIQLAVRLADSHV